MSILASSKASKDITIYTDEGDKVTISYDRETQASYENLKALVYQRAISVNEDQPVIDQSSAELQAEDLLFEDEQNIAISVQGDLNEEELKDIKNQFAAIESTTYSKNALPEAQTAYRDTTGWDDIQKFIDQMAKMLDESDLKPSKLIKPVRDLFSDIIEDLKEDRPGNRAKRHWADLIGSGLIKRIRQMDDGE